jgi:hypothetical protein
VELFFTALLVITSLAITGFAGRFVYRWYTELR